MTANQIIDETVNYYSADVSRRATDKETDSCEYLTSDGRMCAVGRCLRRCLLQDRNNRYLSGPVESLTNFGKETLNVEEVLQEEYRGFPIDFWSVLQVLHDRDSNWTSTGLTKQGSDNVAELKIKFGELSNDK